MAHPLRRCIVVGAVVAISSGAPVLAFGHWSTTDPILDPDVYSEARRLYGTSNLKIYAAFPHDWSAAFPGYSLLAVFDLDHHPASVHLMAFSGNLHRGYNVTSEFNLLQHSLVLTTAADAIKLARAYAESANPEYHSHKDVVGTADATGLGYPVTDPVATAVTGGWDVAVWTWSETNGVVSEWQIKIRLGVVSEGIAQVRALRKGTFERDWESPPLTIGMQMVNAYAAAHSLAVRLEGESWTFQLEPALAGLAFTTVATATTFDGTIVRVLATGAIDSATSAFATAVAEAGRRAYRNLVHHHATPTSCASGNNPNATWGFIGRDADCVLRFVILPSSMLVCGACSKFGNETEVYISRDIAVIVKDRVAWYANGSYYNESEVGGLAASHLLLTHLASRDLSHMPDVNHASIPGPMLRNDATVDTHHSDALIFADPAFGRIRAALEVDTNFSSLTPFGNGERRLLASFNGKPTIQPPSHLLPAGWTLAMYDRRGTPAMDNMTVDTTDVPVAEWNLVGPGSKIETSSPLASHGCTANFVFAEAAGTLYLGTAGHCFFPRERTTVGGQQVSTLKVETGSTIDKRAQGAKHFLDLSQTPVVVRVCVKDCERTASAEPQICPPIVELTVITDCVRWNGTFRLLGTLVYADNFDTDFAIIRIDPVYNASGKVRPHLPMWGGPVGRGCQPLPPHGDTGPLPYSIGFVYGNANAFGETAPQKPRTGVILSCNDESFQMAAPMGPGDSGSAILTAAVLDSTNGFANKQAVGVTSKLDQGRVQGDTLPKILSQTASDTGTSLELRCEGWKRC